MPSPAMSALTWPAGGEARGVIDGPSGALEAAIQVPDEAPRGVIIVCHPHPQHGGTLDNKVTYMTARAAYQSGFVAVRFNYRGVGHSGGTYNDGRGELDDARAVRDWALAQSGAADAGLAGFSFGAWVALRLAVADGAPSLTTIGLPVEYFEGALPRPDTRWLAVFGDADNVIEVDAAIAAVRACRPSPQMHVMAGAGHFLHGRLGELRRIVATHLSAV